VSRQSVNRMSGRSGNQVIGNRRQEGYILLTLMLMVALMIIAMAAVLPSITTQIRRDREQEFIHRGAQYARAIKRYYKKSGSYPATLDQLNNTNNIRFLRKRYKDPITGQDFRLLHYGDVQLSLGQGGFQANVLGGAQAGSGLNAPQAQGSSPFSSPSQSSSPFSSPFSSASAQTGSAPGGFASGGSQQSAPGSFGPTSSASATGGAQSTPAGAISQDTSSGASSSAASQSSSQGTSPSAGSSASSSQTGTQNQTFGGGGIIGVASTSPKKSFHVFNNKDHYKDWAFIYDPGSDRGALITGPYNGPPKFGTGGVPGAVSPGQMQPGSSSTGSTTQTPSSSPFSQSPSTSPFSQSPSTSPFSQSPSSQP